MTANDLAGLRAVTDRPFSKGPYSKGFSAKTNSLTGRPSMRCS